MNISIEILPFVSEKKIPLIKLSKSKKGNAGSATFIFIKPQAFKKNINCVRKINSVRLVYENQEIITQHLTLSFDEGEPFALKALFIFKTENEYSLFFNFIMLYAKRNKLTYLKD